MEQQTNPMQENINFIRENITAPALYECLAEECSELAQASLKRARILRKENPTPMDEIEAMKNFKEEVSDVILLMNVLGLSNDDEMMLLKSNRWVGRIREVINSQRMGQPQAVEELTYDNETEDGEPDILEEDRGGQEAC